MREILFRGQTRRYGEKVYVPSGEKVPSNWVYGGIFPEHPSHNGRWAIIYQQEPTVEKFPVYADTVGQYTGLKDKNGVRIFEGDIIKGGEATNYALGIIECGAYGQLCGSDLTHIGFYIDWKGEEGQRIMRRDLGYWNEKCEIVGNVYDTPELLKGGENNA